MAASQNGYGGNHGRVNLNCLAKMPVATYDKFNALSEHDELEINESCKSYTIGDVIDVAFHKPDKTVRRNKAQNKNKSSDVKDVFACLVRQSAKFEEISYD